MSVPGLILYGPPASGKSTITQLLEESGGFALFPRLKVGGGNTVGYRMTSPEDLKLLRESGQLLWENERYGASYAVDRSHLDAMLREDSSTPVLHLGQPEGVEAILTAYPPQTWLVVELRTQLADAQKRIRMRRDTDEDERLEAWAATPTLGRTDVLIDTSRTSPQDAAGAVRQGLMQHSAATNQRFRPRI